MECAKCGREFTNNERFTFLMTPGLNFNIITYCNKCSIELLEWTLNGQDARS